MKIIKILRIMVMLATLTMANTASAVWSPVLGIWDTLPQYKGLLLRQQLVRLFSQPLWINVPKYLCLFS